MDEANVFSRLFRCASRNQENFLTEALVVLLTTLKDREGRVAARLLRLITDGFLDVPPERMGDLVLRTQVPTLTGRPDIELRWGEWLVYVEIKYDAPFSDSQRERYYLALSAADAAKTQLVTLTRYEDHSPDCRNLRWVDLADFLEDALTEETWIDPVSEHLVRQFLAFLAPLGLSMDKVEASLAEGLLSLTRMTDLIEEGTRIAGILLDTRGGTWRMEWQNYWFGAYLENRRYTIGLNFDQADRLVFRTWKHEVDPLKVEEGWREGLYANDYPQEVPGSHRWKFEYDLNRIDGWFFRVHKKFQRDAIAEFLAEAVAIARRIERKED